MEGKFRSTIFFVASDPPPQYPQQNGRVGRALDPEPSCIISQ